MKSITIILCPRILHGSHVGLHQTRECNSNAVDSVREREQLAIYLSFGTNSPNTMMLHLFVFFKSDNIVVLQCDRISYPGVALCFASGTRVPKQSMLFYFQHSYASDQS